MITETIYIQRDNTFSLRLLRGGDPIDLQSVTGYALYLPGRPPITDASAFIEKPDGVVEIAIGRLLGASDVRAYKAWLVTYDPSNTAGVRWPAFKLKVKA